MLAKQFSIRNLFPNLQPWPKEEGKRRIGDSFLVNSLVLSNQDAFTAITTFDIISAYIHYIIKIKVVSII